MFMNHRPADFYGLALRYHYSNAFNIFCISLHCTGIIHLLRILMKFSLNELQGFRAIKELAYGFFIEFNVLFLSVVFEEGLD